MSLKDADLKGENNKLVGLEYVNHMYVLMYIVQGHFAKYLVVSNVHTARPEELRAKRASKVYYTYSEQSKEIHRRHSTFKIFLFFYVCSPYYLWGNEILIYARIQWVSFLPFKYDRFMPFENA